MHLEGTLEIVAKFWLKKHFGLQEIKTSFAFKGGNRYYTIDLYGSRREGWKNSPHYFTINCIHHKVKKTHFVNCKEALQHIRELPTSKDVGFLLH